MFCSKCGYQLPDNAQFCTGCGAQINTTSAPNVATPVQPTYTYVQPVMEAPKKSKAPVFIALGIGIVALIVAIVAVVLLLTSGDKNKKDENPSSGNDTQIDVDTDENESDEDESDDIVIEPTTNDSDDDTMDLNDATDIAAEFMTYLKTQNFAAAADMFMPGMKDFASANSLSVSAIAEGIYYLMCDESGNFYSDYEVEDAIEDDGLYFELYVKGLISSYDTYIEPTSFAAATINVTYNGMEGTAVIYLAYCDDSIYVVDLDDVGINFGSGSDITDTDDVSIEDMLANYTVELTGGTYSGTTYTGDGYSIVIPDGWTNISTNNLPQFLSPDELTWFNINVVPYVGSYDSVDYFESVFGSYSNMGIHEYECGTVTTPNCTGYFSAYIYDDSDGNAILGYQYHFIGNDGTGYIFTIETYNDSTDYYKIGDYAAASLVIE